MNRQDFVLLWKKDNKYICNICRFLDGNLDGNMIIEGLFCPIDSNIVKCEEYQTDSFFDNKACEIIITHQNCNARQHGCINDCTQCVVMMNFSIHVS